MPDPFEISAAALVVPETRLPLRFRNAYGREKRKRMTMNPEDTI